MSHTKKHPPYQARRDFVAKLQVLLQQAYAAELPIAAAGLQRTIEAVGWEMAENKEQAHKALKRGGKAAV